MKTFEELGVCPEICQAIQELGFEHPMPIQEAVAPLLINPSPTPQADETATSDNDESLAEAMFDDNDSTDETPQPANSNHNLLTGEFVNSLIGNHNSLTGEFVNSLIRKDLIALAQTGTGKTAAFGIPLLQMIEPHKAKKSSPDTHAAKRGPQAVVLSPTRELCLQITDDLRDFSKYLKGINIVAVYGGTSISDQIRQLRHGAEIVVATPGRLIDLMERGKLDLSGVRHVVLDEADEMLNMGFSDSINAIFEAIPDDRQTLLFSATMSKEVERIAKNYLHEYEEIVVGSRNEGAENVNHVYYMVNAKDKYLALKRVVDFYPRIYGIVFCRTKIETQEIADKLIRDGYNAESLHGDLSQQQRDQTMQKFRQHLTQLLVATDVAARGLDVNDLTHVINYSMPDDTESYTHRSGRTGRAGKKGTSIAIIHSRERHKVREVEKIIGKEFVRGKLPSPQEICTKQLFRAIDEIEKTDVVDEQIEPFMVEVRRHFEFVDKEEILKKLVSREFGRFLKYYADAPEIEEIEEKSRRKGDRDGGDRVDWKSKKPSGKVQKGYTRLFINLGKNDGFYPGEVMQFINRNMRGHRQDVGHIDLMPTFCCIEVPEKDGRKVINALNGSFYHNRKVVCRVDNGAPDAGRGKDSASRSKDSAGRPNKDSAGRPNKNGRYLDDFTPREGRRGNRGKKRIEGGGNWKAAVINMIEKEEGWARRKPRKK